MNSLSINTTPNWFLNQVLAVAPDCLTIAYCARVDITVFRNAYASSAFGFDSKTISQAHKDKAVGCVFSPVTDVNKSFYKNLVSFGDDGVVKIWNLVTGKCVMVNNAHLTQIESGHKLVGVDWLKTDTHVIVSVTDNNIIMRWALESNTVKQYLVKSKTFPQCIAASPHDKDIVALGSKCGHVIIFSMKTISGTILGRVRCGDNDIMSLSWCPVPFDVIFKKEASEPKYLVVGAKDYNVFIVETNQIGSRQKYDCAQLVTNVCLPHVAINKQQSKSNRTFKKDHGWSIVCWANPLTVITTTKFAEVVSFQTEALDKVTHGLQYKFKLVHDRHNSKPILSLACPQTTETDGIDQTIWTIAVDRHLIRHSLQHQSLTIDLHTCTSYVYDLQLSRVPDDSRLAIGLGEGKVLIWNTYKTSFLDLQEYWQKIDGKVMKLSFHPIKEGLLAFSTALGVVGILDISSRNRMPIISFSLSKSNIKSSECEKMAVYSICWGPKTLFPDDGVKRTEEYCLYGVSNGDLYAFTPAPNFTKALPPVNLKSFLDKIDSEAQLSNITEGQKRCDISWKPDFSWVAIANDNGIIHVLTNEGKLLVSLWEHKKLINSMAWHPEFMTSGSSPYKNWFATASDVIKVFNIDVDNLNIARQPVASLSLHSSKVTCVSWSPHINGQLLSTSYDGVAQIWDVINQTALFSYHGHLSHVMAGLFSPLDPDMVITSSADGTVHSWRMSKQTSKLPSDKKKINNGSETAAIATFDGVERTKDEYKQKIESGNHRGGKLRPKSLFPISGTQLGIGNDVQVLVNRYIKNSNPDNPVFVGENTYDGKDDNKDSVENGTHGLENGTAANIGNASDSKVEMNGHSASNEDVSEESEEPKVDNSLYINFFGTREEMSHLVQSEFNQHINNKHISGAVTTSLWLGNYNKVVQMAIQKEELNDEIVALAVTSSIKSWRDCCEAYAKQLTASGFILKAAHYLLAIHKVEEAVTLFLKHNHFKEAVCLAKLRLPENHELLKTAYQQWAEYSVQHGNFSIAAHIYLQRGDGTSAMSILNKSNDPRLQYYSCILAMNTPNMLNISINMLENTFKRSLERLPNKIAEDITQNHPEKRQLALWYYGRVRSSEMLESQDALSSWHISPEIKRQSILEKIASDVKHLGISEEHINMLKSLVSTCEGMDKYKALVYISGQLAIASVTLPEEQLRHLLFCLKIAYKLQSRIIVFPAIFNAALFPNGPKNDYELLDVSKSANPDYTKSIRAFYCNAIINWLYYCENKELAQEEKLDILEHTLNNYIEDVITISSVEYYKAHSDTLELEQSLCQQVVKENIQKTDSMDNISTENKVEINQNISGNDELLTKTNEDIRDEEIDTGKEENEKVNSAEESKEINIEDKTDIDVEKIKETSDEQMDKNPNEGETDNGEEKIKETSAEQMDKNPNEGETDNGEEKIKDNDDGQMDKRQNEEKNPKLEIDENEKMDNTNDKKLIELQDFEKATNPKYDIELPRDEAKKEEEELTREDKLNKLKELQELITNYENTKIYSPNPSVVFDLIYKVLKSFNFDNSELNTRVTELCNLLQTHTEAFELV